MPVGFAHDSAAQGFIDATNDRVVPCRDEPTRTARPMMRVLVAFGYRRF
jgi:hypothetical protein